MSGKEEIKGKGGEIWRRQMKGEKVKRRRSK